MVRFGYRTTLNEMAGVIILSQNNNAPSINTKHSITTALPKLRLLLDLQHQHPQQSILL
jgi:hypothetical protein